MFKNILMRAIKRSVNEAVTNTVQNTVANVVSNTVGETMGESAQFCMRCGAKLASGDRFCPDCHRKVRRFPALLHYPAGTVRGASQTAY